MNKKLVALVLAVVCVFTATFAYASTGYNKIEKQTNAIELMISVGVMEEAERNEPERFITRREAANYVAKLVAPEVSVSVKQVFDDVAADDSAANALTILTDLNIVSKNASVYRPDENVLQAELVKMTVAMLGKAEAAEHKGGYPSGYYRVANEFRLLKNVISEKNGVTVADCATVLANALEANYDLLGSYYVSGLDSYMETGIGVTKEKGIIENNGITSLYEKTYVSDNIFKLNGKLFYYEKDVKDLLGYRADVYYREDEVINGGYEVVALIVPSSYNETLTIKYDQNLKFKDNIYTYTMDDDGDDYDAILSSGAVVVYNQVAVSAADYIGKKFDMIPSYGEVTLVDNDKDGEYDIVKINNYENFVVSGYNVDERTLYGYNGAASIVIPKKNYKVYDANGSEIALDKATKTDVTLMIAESVNKDYMEIIASEETFFGKVTQINADDNIYKIDESIYSLAPEFSETINVGSTGTFFVNAWNNIVRLKTGAASEYAYAYVMQAGKSKGAFSTNKVKVYTQYNMLKEFDMAKKVKIDGVSYDGNASKVADILANCVDEVVLFQLNLNSEIIYLDTSLDGDYAGITKFSGMNHQRVKFYNEPGRTFEGRAFVTDDTIAFVIPQNGDEDYIAAMTGAEYKKLIRGSQIEKDVTVYRYGSDDSVKVASVIDKVGYTGSRREKGAFSIITDIGVAMNELGNECYRVSLNRNGVESELYTSSKEDFIYECDGKYYTIGLGDLIYYSTDKNGYISKGHYIEPDLSNRQIENITLIYSAKEGWFNYRYTPEYSSDYSTDMNVKFCYIYDRTDLDGFYKVSFVQPSAVTDESQIFIYNMGDFRNMFAFDKETGKTKTILHNEFVTYTDAQTDDGCTKMVFFKNTLNSGGVAAVFK